MLYHFRKTFGFDPGAQAYVFGMEWSLPRSRVGGAGYPAGGYFKPFQPGGQAFQNQSIPTSGIGGVITGGIVFQPLGNNPNQ